MAKKKVAAEPAPKSKKFDKVKYYYDNGYWAINRVHDAVGHGWITAEEFKEITGIDYDSGEES